MKWVTRKIADFVDVKPAIRKTSLSEKNRPEILCGYKQIDLSFIPGVHS